jgi:tetratricopeptide (TPR) repeat protein
MTRHMLTTLFGAAGAIAIVAAAQPRAQTGNDLASIAARIEKAYLATDTQGLKEGRTACLRLLTTDRSPLIRYTVAYAGWRLAFAAGLPAAEQNDLLADAESQVTQAIKADPKFAEAYGLLSSILGTRIAKNTDLGMTLGPQSGEAIEKAISLEPDNPRLVFIQAQDRYNTPVEYGGSVKEAEALYRRALQLFDREAADKAWPNWGRFDAQAWLGQALLKRGDRAGAREAFTKALEIAPGNMWVRMALLPQAK